MFNKLWGCSPSLLLLPLPHPSCRITSPPLQRSWRGRVPLGHFSCPCTIPARPRPPAYQTLRLQLTRTHVSSIPSICLSIPSVPVPPPYLVWMSIRRFQHHHSRRAPSLAHPARHCPPERCPRRRPHPSPRPRQTDSLAPCHCHCWKRERWRTDTHLITLPLPLPVIPCPPLLHYVRYYCTPTGRCQRGWCNVAAGRHRRSSCGLRHCACFVCVAVAAVVVVVVGRWRRLWFGRPIRHGGRRVPIGIRGRWTHRRRAAHTDRRAVALSTGWRRRIVLRWNGDTRDNVSIIRQGLYWRIFY